MAMCGMVMALISLGPDQKETGAGVMAASGLIIFLGLALYSVMLRMHFKPARLAFVKALHGFRELRTDTTAPV